MNALTRELLKECRGLIANYLEGIEGTDKVIERIDMAISALPVEGMMLVPTEPTEEMIAAAGASLWAHASPNKRERIVHAYKAMLQSAPTAPDAFHSLIDELAKGPITDPSLLAAIYARAKEADRTRLAAVERDAAVGAAIQRAAGELPDDYVVSIDVERGAASVDICSPDGDYITMDVDVDNRLASEINAAIDAALAAKG